MRTAKILALSAVRVCIKPPFCTLGSTIFLFKTECTWYSSIYRVFKVDKKVIQDVAHGIPEAMNKSMIKHCCKKEKVSVLRWNITDDGNNSYTTMEEHCLEQCKLICERICK